MKSNVVFFKAWTIFFIVVTSLVLGCLTTAWYFGLPGQIFWLLCLLPFIYIGLVLGSRDKVEPNFVVVHHWFSKALEPIPPGFFFPFKYFGLLDEGTQVPVNDQKISILTGSRKGLPEDVINNYVYGSSLNMHSKSGSNIKLIYDVIVRCVDPVKIISYLNSGDPYESVVDRVELSVNAYIRARHSEAIINNLGSENWDEKVLFPVRSSILSDIGVKLISFRPVAIITAPEIDNMRLAVEIESRKGKIIKAETANAVEKEKGRGRILRSELANMDVNIAASAKKDKIRANEANLIMSTMGVDGVTALSFVLEKEKLQTFLEISKTGKVVFIEDLLTKKF